MQQLLAYVPEPYRGHLAAQPPEVVTALVVVLATLLLSIIYSFIRPKSKRGSVVLIAGPCNSGKTTLFYQLRDGSTHNGMVASMQENSGSVQVKNEKGRSVGSVNVLDVPGHERLRHKLEQHLCDAAAVVFVIDAVDITPHKVEGWHGRVCPRMLSCRCLLGSLSRIEHRCRPVIAPAAHRSIARGTGVLMWWLRARMCTCRWRQPRSCLRC